jgi:hypothetical protein
MINTTTEFKKALEKNSVCTKKATILLKNGTLLNVDDSKISQGGLKIDDGISNQKFDVGTAVVNKLTLNLNNRYDDFSGYDFTNAVVTVWVGKQLTDRIEWLKKGVFNTDDPTSTPAILTLECLDNMSKFDTAYDGGISFPATLQALVQHCCTQCGVLLADGQFPNYNYRIERDPFGDNSITYRAIIAYCVLLAGCYARCNTDGRLEFKWYDTAAFDGLIDGGVFDKTDADYYQTGDNLDGGNFTNYSSGDSADGGTFTEALPYHHIYSFSSLSVSTEDVVITGIRVTAVDSEDSTGKKVEGETYLCGVDGYILDVSGNPLIEAGKAKIVAEYLASRIVGMRFRPFTASAIGDPSWEAGDAVVITDRKGNSYKTYLTNVTYSTGGYASISCDADPPARHSADRYAEINKIVADIKKDNQQKLSEYAQYLDQMNQLAVNAMGYYETVDTQDDGSTVTYMHDKPKLSESTIVYKQSIDGFFWSQDGGKTWNGGIDKSGNAVMNVIAAMGLRADWIDSGRIQVKDDDGNIIFLVDMDTKKIIIAGDSVMIGGQNAVEALDEVRKEAKNARALQISLTNDYQGIPTDEKGHYSTIDAGTKVSVLYGHMDVSADCSYTLSESAGIAGIWDKAARTYTVTGLSTDNGWVDITVAYLSTFTVTKRFSVSKIKNGAPGDSPKLCAITGGQVIKYESGSSAPVPESLTLTAEYQNTTHGKWQYRNASGVWTDFVPVQTKTAITIPEDSSAWVGSTAVLRAVDTTQTAMDTITLAKLRDGEKGDAGTTGTGYTVLLSNESYVFAGNVTAAIAGSTSTDVTAFKNTVQIAATVTKIGNTTVSGNATGVATGFNGLTAAVTGNGTTACKISFTATSSLTTKNGSVPLTITVDGKTYTKYFSFSLSLKGDSGAAGRTYFIEPSTDILKRSQDNSINPNFVQFNSYYRDGSSATRTAYAGRWIIEETTDGNTWTTIYTSSANESSVKHYLYSMLANASGNALANANGDTVGIPRDVVLIRAKLYAAGETTNLMDMQGVAVVTDIDALTHEEIFNLLTKNGEVKGIYKEGNQLYISFTYAKGGTLVLGGANNGNGVVNIYDNSGNSIGTIDNSGTSLTGNFKSLHKYFQYIIETQIANGTFSMARSGTEFLNISVSGIKYSDLTLGDMVNIGASGCRFKNLIVSGGGASISGATYINGNLVVASGYSKNKMADTKDYGDRLLYCYETASPLFGDVGQGMTDENGECYVFIDDIFTETVSLDRNYQVFLQKEESGDLWVSFKREDFFLVKGSPNLKFAWELKARQKKWESERLEIFDKTEKRDEEVDYEEMAANMVASFYEGLEVIL